FVEVELSDRVTDLHGRVPRTAVVGPELLCFRVDPAPPRPSDEHLGECRGIDVDVRAADVSTRHLLDVPAARVGNDIVDLRPLPLGREARVAPDRTADSDSAVVED